MQFNHFNISAPQTLLAQTCQFYCQLFELQVGARPNFQRAGFWLYRADDISQNKSQAIIHLTASDKHQLPIANSYLDHIAFNMHDIEAFKLRLDKMDIPYHQQLVPDTHTTQLFFTDPAGIKLEAIFE